MTLTPEVAHLAQQLRPAAPPAQPLKIFYWAASEEDGTWRYRLKIPGDELARRGHEVQISPRLGAWARDEADIIVGQRICRPGPATLWQMVAEERRKSGRGGLVYEVDDDLFGINDKTNPLGGVFKHPAVQESMRASLRAANGVTVSTAPLADVVRKVRGPKLSPHDVHVVPNAVPGALLTTVRQSPPRRAVMYGWQGSATHAADWEVARAAVVSVLNEDPAAARLRFLGTPQSIEGILPGRKVDYRGWTTDIEQHYQGVAEFDVSLAPLENTRFNRSKSALRIEESLALGVPVVASDVPAYRGWVRDGVDGFIVPASAAKWATALRAMQDPHRRADMAAAGREAAAAWTVEATAHRWLDAYYAILER